MKETKLNIGIVGLGYFGPNWLRNVKNNAKYDLSWICDLNAKRLEKFSSVYNLDKDSIFTDVDKAIDFKNPDLVLIATPPSTHLALGEKLINKKINLIIEKPMGLNIAETEKLVNLSSSLGTHLFIDNTYIFTPVARKIKQIINSGEIGDLQFIFSSRLNLGLIQKDVDVIRDLAIHDISLLDFFLEKLPLSIHARAVTHKPATVNSTASIDLSYENGLLAQLGLSWNSPVKVRSMIISGSKKSILWDDTNQTEKLKLFDASANFESNDPNRHISYTLGDTTTFSLENQEAISVELDHIYDVIVNKVQALNGKEHILRVSKVLESCESSLING